MTGAFFEVRLCGDCGLRYPLVGEQPVGERCPSCLGATSVVLTRPLPIGDRVPAERARPDGKVTLRIEAVLDNVRSEWNVGAIFRTADALGVDKLYLSGITPTPANPALAKTALGAESWISWEYVRDAVQLAHLLIAQGVSLWGLEQDQRAQDISEMLLMAPRGEVRAGHEPRRIALVLGNEITGVDPGLLELCEHVLSIAMKGRKRSLNVAVAFGIAAYRLSLLRDQ